MAEPRPAARFALPRRLVTPTASVRPRPKPGSPFGTRSPFSGTAIPGNTKVSFSGTPGPSPLGITPVCFWNYTGFDNLVEEEDRYQVYGEVNYDFNDDTRLHLEGLYGNTDVPHWRTSPVWLSNRAESWRLRRS